MTIFTNSIDAAADEAGAYIEAVLELLGDRDPNEVLEASVEVYTARCAGLDEAQLRTPEARGKWSVVEIVQHMADSELVWAYRLRSVAAEDGSPLTGYDQDLWASAMRYPDVPLSDALDQFRSLRRVNLRLLRSLTPAQWEHSGMHSERGRESIAHMVKLYAGHDLVHLAQLDRVRRVLLGEVPE